MKLKFLLIGGNGLLGYSVANFLVKKNFDVTIISRTNKKILSKKIKWIKANYHSQKIDKIINKNNYDIIINFIIFKPQQALRDINYFKRKKILRYYFISSTSVYKETKSKISEQTKVYDGRWPYAKEKYKCERKFLQAYKKGFPVIIIRAGHIYSENTLPTPFVSSGYEYVSYLMKAKYAIIPFTLKKKWSLLHTNDFAKNFGKVLTVKTNNKINLINIASEKKILWKEIILVYIKYLKKRIKFKKINLNNLPKRISTAIKGDRAKNCSYNNKLFKKNFGKFIEKENTKKKLKLSIKNYFEKKKFKHNNKIIKLFFKIEKKINF
jgi:nucleoside-diphosphate-sugar epimerase